MADAKLSALPQQSVPALGDFTYIDDITGPTSNKQSWDRILGTLLTLPVQGRLTTESGVAVSTSDRTAQGTLYYTPYLGKIVTLYDGTRWRVYSTAEVSLALTVTSGKNYDVFLYDNAGTVTIELSAAWTNDTTPADQVSGRDTGTGQDGVKVKSGAATRRWVGTIRASGANVTEDSAAKRFVWNFYNQVPRPVFIKDTTVSWTYNTDAFRQVNANGANQVAVIVGLPSEIDLTAVSGLGFVPDFGDAVNAIGEDSTTTPHSLNLRANASVHDTTTSAARDYAQLVASLSTYVPLGYHFYAWLERADTATTTWLGNSGGAYYATGLAGKVVA